MPIFCVPSFLWSGSCVPFFVPIFSADFLLCRVLFCAEISFVFCAELEFLCRVFLATDEIKAREQIICHEFLKQLV